MDSFKREKHHSQTFDFTEEDLGNAYLAIYHYRYTGLANLREKCQPKKSLFVGYKIGSPEKCVKELEKLNSPDIFDDRMIRKWNWRHGTSITVSRTP